MDENTVKNLIRSELRKKDIEQACAECLGKFFGAEFLIKEAGFVQGKSKGVQTDLETYVANELVEILEFDLTKAPSIQSLKEAVTFEVGLSAQYTSKVLCGEGEDLRMYDISRLFDLSRKCNLPIAHNEKQDLDLFYILKNEGYNEVDSSRFYLNGGKGNKQLIKAKTKLVPVDGLRAIGGGNWQAKGELNITWEVFDLGENATFIDYYKGLRNFNINKEFKLKGSLPQDSEWQDKITLDMGKGETRIGYYSELIQQKYEDWLRSQLKGMKLSLNDVPESCRKSLEDIEMISRGKNVYEELKEMALRK